MIWRRAEILAFAAFVLLTALLIMQEMRHGKISPSEDDCAARGQAADCWKTYTYEFVAPDERSEPRSLPKDADDCTARGRDEECWRER